MDASKVQAEFKNGVLHVHLPKSATDELRERGIRSRDPGATLLAPEARKKRVEVAAT